MGVHAIITGASSGIGEALAVELARRGFSVGLVARREEKLRALAERIRGEGGEVAYAVGDVSSRASVGEAFEQLEQSLGPCQLMVANAGIGGPTNARDLDLDLTLKTFEVNTFGAIYAAHAALPGMLERGSGQLVVVSSVAATRGLPGSGAYSASKAAISTFWESMRVDLEGTPLVVTTLHPGFVKTPLTDKNDFDMPFIIPAEKAAGLMADAIAREDRTYTFPVQMAMVEWSMKRLPSWIFDRLTAGRR